MKSFKQYIAESVKTYEYRICIAGDIDPNRLDLFKHNLQKFSPIKISEPKSTPIQKKLINFPDVENERMTTIEVDFRYPATEPMVKQLAQLLGLDENKVRMLSLKYDDSINTEADAYANQMREEPLLGQEEMGSAPGAKEANKAYGESYLNSIKDQMKGNTIDIPYEGKKTPAAFDPFKVIPQDKAGAKSPMSTITRPAKPATGARK